MILQRLIEYADASENATPTMYMPRPVRWAIVLDMEGNFKGFVEMKGDPTKKKDRGKIFLLPHLERTVGIVAKLLSDNGEYVLGLMTDDPKETPEKREKRKEKVKIRHKTFIERVEDCYVKSRDPYVLPILNFIKNINIDKLSIPETMDAKDEITFRIDDTHGNSVFPINRKAVQSYWKNVGAEGEKKGEQQNFYSCIFCGELKPCMEIHPIKIKNIPGGQTSGMAIISANALAFESYGLKGSLIAPTCADCAEKYGKAINELIASPKNTMTTGKLRYIFWTASPSDFSPISFLDKPEPGEVKRLIGSFRSGQAENLEIDEEAFYACSVSASGGRVAFRDWIESTIGNVRKNLTKWFQLQSLVDPYGKEGEPMGIYPLSACLYRESKDIVANVPKNLIASAIKGINIPLELLFLAVKRNHAEQTITRPRAVLIKMALISNFGNHGKEDYMNQLEPEETNPAYLCGRLLAELEALQKVALPGIKATLVDRFFGTASSAPASVFGRLMRGAQAHLSKLRKEKPRVHGAIQKRLEEIQSKLTAFPKTLSLENQGLFSLGYYHQRAKNRAEIEAYMKERENSETEVESEDN